MNPGATQRIAGIRMMVKKPTGDIVPWKARNKLNTRHPVLNVKKTANFWRTPRALLESTELLLVFCIPLISDLPYEPPDAKQVPSR